jgi:hypothetical protein
VVYSVKNEDFSSELKLNLNDLTSGIYIKSDGEGLSYTEKIILN